MHGFIDLHCHWVSDIDDGVRVPERGVEVLRGLRALGFETVFATPHMRPGMFDNDRAMLETAFAAMDGPLAQAREEGPLPQIYLASEHWFDEVVFQRIRAGGVLPYPSLGPPPAPSKTGWMPPARKRGLLVEFSPERFPLDAHRRFYDVHKAGMYPVIAHPERYAPVWARLDSLQPFLDAGAYLLLDLCSLVGKYGRAAQKASEKLLEMGAYMAACSDVHKPEDLEDVERSMERLRKISGDDAVTRLLRDGPRQILHLPNRV